LRSNRAEGSAAKFSRFEGPRGNRKAVAYARHIGLVAAQCTFQVGTHVVVRNTLIHPTAHVDSSAVIGAGTRIWVNVQIREGAIIGNSCILAKDVYIDRGVRIGKRCKIQNGVSLYQGVTLGDDVFVGPYATFTNDRVPRAFNRDWQMTPTVVEVGASIGANATIVCGIKIGAYAMVAAGSVVTRDVSPYTLVRGNPARPCAHIDRHGNKVGSIGG
jgi:UDP-2-acetamido-3-amino-2,3-dideoxy-glucuronate N-acetyltransferase